jgi:hypothetical protein
MNRKRLIISVWVILSWIALTSSAVMCQDAHSQHGTHSAGATEKVFQAEMSVPDEIRPGESFTINIHIQDDKGHGVADFDIFQEKLMHLILVSDDLEFFSHLHPEYKGNGHFQTKAILPSVGAYTLFSDYKPAGQREQLSVLKLRIKGTKRSSGVTDTNITEKTVEDTKASINFSPRMVKANEDTIIIFDLKQGLDGKPVTKLEPYLGEKGHLVVIRKSAALTTKDYIHAHAMKESGVSEIKFMTRFPAKGLYKLWCQFNREGKILTADFWINIKR